MFIIRLIIIRILKYMRSSLFSMVNGSENDVAATQMMQKRKVRVAELIRSIVKKSLLSMFIIIIILIQLNSYTEKQRKHYYNRQVIQSK